MNSHLSEDQITGWVLGTCDDSVLRHLEACRGCCVEAEELRSALSGFRDALQAAAQRDQTFWRNQQVAFRDRASARDWYPMHWAWLVAMVMVLITAIFLTRAPNTLRNNPSDDADNALLNAVQGDLSREVPQALAPAVLIAEERNAILMNSVMRQSKKTQNKK